MNECGWYATVMTERHAIAAPMFLCTFMACARERDPFYDCLLWERKRLATLVCLFECVCVRKFRMKIDIMKCAYKYINKYKKAPTFITILSGFIGRPSILFSFSSRPMTNVRQAFEESL